MIQAIITSPFVLAAASEIPLVVASWEGMIDELEAAGRSEAVLRKIRAMPELAGLASLRALTEPSETEPLPALTIEATVHTVDRILRGELGEETTVPAARRPVSPTSLTSPIPSNFFGGVDPRSTKIQVATSGDIIIYNAGGKGIGMAKLCAGGREVGHLHTAFTDSPHLSAATVMGGRSYQQDGIYLASYLLPDGTVVKIMAGSDGTGEGFGGEIMSSAFLQGVHAGVADAALRGDIPEGGMLFEQGKLAARHQTELDPQISATATGVVVVVVGRQATAATAGDSMLTHLRWEQEGFYRAVGYSEVDATSINELGNDIFHTPQLYLIPDLLPDDRLLIGSDGLLENLLGIAYKERGSEFIRMIRASRGTTIQIPDQRLFHNLCVLAEATREYLERAPTWIAWAQETMSRPGGRHRFGERTLELPARATSDNMLVIDYRQGLAAATAVVGISPEFYRPLNRVG